MTRLVSYWKAVLAGMAGALAWEIVARLLIWAGLPMFERKSNGAFESAFDSSRFSDSDPDERPSSSDEVPVAAAVNGAPAPVVEEPKDDLDMPAFLRRDRKLFQ